MDSDRQKIASEAASKGRPPSAGYINGSYYTSAEKVSILNNPMSIGKRSDITPPLPISPELQEFTSSLTNSAVGQRINSDIIQLGLTTLVAYPISVWLTSPSSSALLTYLVRWPAFIMLLLLVLTIVHLITDLQLESRQIGWSAFIAYTAVESFQGFFEVTFSQFWEWFFIITIFILLGGSLYHLFRQRNKWENWATLTQIGFIIIGFYTFNQLYPIFGTITFIYYNL